MLFSTSAMPGRMACFGASGTGVQVSLDVRYQAAGDVEFIGYVDDFRDERRRTEPEFPVLSFDDLLTTNDVGVFVSVFDPAGRRTIFERLSTHDIPIIGARGLPHLAHPSAEVGEGTIVICTTRLGHTTVIGRGGVVLADLIAHDVEIGDFTSLGAGSIVLGHVQIGSGCFVGTGAIIQNGTIDRPLVIGDNVVVGAGAVVTRDLADGQIVAGPRARSVVRWKSSSVDHVEDQPPS